MTLQSSFRLSIKVNDNFFIWTNWKSLLLKTFFKILSFSCTKGKYAKTYHSFICVKNVWLQLKDLEVIWLESTWSRDMDIYCKRHIFMKFLFISDRLSFTSTSKVGLLLRQVKSFFCIDKCRIFATTKATSVLLSTELALPTLQQSDLELICVSTIIFVVPFLRRLVSLHDMTSRRR